MKLFFTVAVALMTTVSINLAQAGATSNEGGPQSIGGGPPSDLGAAGIPDCTCDAVGKRNGEEIGGKDRRHDFEEGDRSAGILEHYPISSV